MQWLKLRSGGMGRIIQRHPVRKWGAWDSSSLLSSVLVCFPRPHMAPPEVPAAGRHLLVRVLPSCRRPGLWERAPEPGLQGRGGTQRGGCTTVSRGAKVTHFTPPLSAESVGSRACVPSSIQAAVCELLPHLLVFRR